MYLFRNFKWSRILDRGISVLYIVASLNNCLPPACPWGRLQLLSRPWEVCVHFIPNRHFDICFVPPVMRDRIVVINCASWRLRSWVLSPSRSTSLTGWTMACWWLEMTPKMGLNFLIFSLYQQNEWGRWVSMYFWSSTLWGWSIFYCCLEGKA